MNDRRHLFSLALPGLALPVLCMGEGENSTNHDDRIGDTIMKNIQKTALVLAIIIGTLPSCDNENDIPIADLPLGPESQTEMETETSTIVDNELLDTEIASDTDEVVATDSEIGDTEPQTISSSFRVRGSVGQIHIWGAEPHADMEVVDSSGSLIFSGATDEQGSLIFRDVPPGHGYLVRMAATPSDFTDKLVVMSVENSLPDDSFYREQKLEPGFGYITTRDGTTLSVFVSLPGPIEKGPYPTLISYSGYSPSKPGGLRSHIPAELCLLFPVLCDAPNHDIGLIGGAMGYATVGVNMRGTGCSGGAYDYFETLQRLDGYDAVEIIARQPWVKHNKVGLAGLSYPGISQLFVASTKPPSLAAIAPLSVLADSLSSTLAPGGILNDGFAVGWIETVMNGADSYGQGWERTQVEQGDLICEENQLLHSQKKDLISIIWSNSYYSEALNGPLDPRTFVQEIEVPVFLAGQWQDEQTGPHFAALFDKFTGSPLTRFTVTNGVHPDGYAPQTLVEWKAFFDFYVSREIPSLDPIIYALAPILISEVYGTSLELPPMRFTEYDDFETALAAYESEKSVRVIFETGAHPDEDPGAPRGAFELKFDSWPIPETRALRLYFQNDGTLGQTAPSSNSGASSFFHDRDAGRRVTLNSGSVDGLLPDYDFRPLIPGKAVAFLSEPLQEDLVMAGHGSVDLWLQSTADDADLEVILTEVRPDGQEMFVQAGWLRASHRTLSSEATELRPVKTHLEEDASPLEPGKWNSVRVEIMPFAHVFRTGSRIRISVDTPGDSCTRWKFVLTEYQTDPTHTIAHNSNTPSSVVLPVIPDAGPPSSLAMPPCPSLRGQPCRAYEIFDNTPSH
jgi:predicted acyl esterase